MSAASRRDPARVAADVVYLLPYKDALVDDLRAVGVETTCLSARPLDPRWVWRLRRHLAARRVDVVHAHSPLLAIAARLVVRTFRPRARPKMVTTDHNVRQSHRRVVRTLDGLTAGLDDAHLAVSRAVMATAPRRVRRRAEVVVHGVDVDGIRDAADRSGVREELGIDHDALVVGTVANLRATKGYPDLLAAARLVLDALPTARFVAVGQGPLETELRQRHERLGLDDRFRFLGYRRDAVRVLSACDVFCMASLHEGLPVALMEAVALGVPVVATDVGGVAEVVTHGEEALLVPPGEPRALAQALIALLGDGGRRDAMAARSAARARTLSVDSAVRRAETIYQELHAR